MIHVDGGWQTLVDTVETKYGAGGFNPLVKPDLGWSWVIFNGMLNSAAVLTWQTTIARVLSAKDTKTGMKVYTRTSFFFVCRFVIPGIWGIAALAMLPEVLPAGKTAVAMPAYLSTAVPVGLMGLLVAAMLAADMVGRRQLLQLRYRVHSLLGICLVVLLFAARQQQHTNQQQTAQSFPH